VLDTQNIKGERERVTEDYLSQSGSYCQYVQEHKKKTIGFLLYTFFVYLAST
jgi:hypothetical protein